MKLHNPKSIISGISLVPLWQCYAVFCIALLGGVMFLTGFYILQNTPEHQQYLEQIPGSLFIIAVGVTTFGMFFSLPFIIILSKRVEELSNEVGELKKEIEELKK